MKDQTIRYYDLLAEQIAERWYPETILVPTIRDLIALLPPPPRVLDLGCGPGYESKRLAAAGARVVGIDLSRESIRIARERTPECRFEVMDFGQLDRRLGTFDGVFASASLIHVSPRDLPQIMARIAGVLNENGYLLAIIRHGQGTRQSHPIVDGQKLQRTIYLYTGNDLAAAAPELNFVRESHLAASLIEQGWRGYLFQYARPAHAG